MALNVRRIDSEMLAALVASMNELRVSLVGSKFHADQTSQSSTPNYDWRNPKAVTAATALAALPSATDLPTTIAIATALISVLGMNAAASGHLQDANAHKVADATNATAIAVPTDLATVQTALNALKTQFNAHAVQAGVHYTNDTAVATANATDLATSEALANAMSTKVVAHLASCTGAYWINLQNP